MRNGFLGSVVVLLASAGLAAAQPYYPQPYYQAPPPPRGYPYGYPPPPNYYGYPPAPMPAYPAYPAYPGYPVYPANFAPQPPAMLPYQQQAMPSAGQNGMWNQPEPAPYYAPRPAAASTYPTASPAAAAQPPLEIQPVPQAGPPQVEEVPGAPRSLKTEAPVPSVDPAPGVGLYSEEGPPPPPWVPPHEAHPPTVGPRGYMFYTDFEGLAWWTRKTAMPGLAANGLPDAAGTSTLIGGNDLEPHERYGVKGSVGFWLNDCQTAAWDFGGFWLAPREQSTALSSPGTPTIFRPFVNAATNGSAAFPVAIPGALSGAIAVNRNESEFWGMDTNLRLELCRTSCFHIDALGGFRYLDLEDSIQIGQNSVVVGPAMNGTQVQSFDSFAARNRFYGGQLGLEGELHYGRWFADLYGKLALGYNDEEVNVGGNTVINTAAGTTNQAGLLTTAANSGQHSHSEFAVLPEVGVNIGYKLATNWRATFGCSALYINRAARAGDDINTTVSLPGAGLATAPTFTWHTTDYWAAGINFGLEFRY